MANSSLLTSTIRKLFSCPNAHHDAAILPEADGAVRVRGTVRLDEVAKALDWPLEHPKVTTVSGLVLLLLGRPALLGDVVTWNQVRVEVTKVAGRGVAEALLTRTAAA
jgi:CBS domain containing-hemolysin-like protein